MVVAFTDFVFDDDYIFVGVTVEVVVVVFNWNSPHTRLNNHYEVWSHKEKKYKMISTQEIRLERTYI